MLKNNGLVMQLQEEKEQVERLKQEYDEKYLLKELDKKVKLNENNNSDNDE